MLCLTTAGSKDAAARTSSKLDTLEARWTPNFFLSDGRQFTLTVYDDDLLRRESLGSRRLTADAHLPASLPADKAEGIYWSATLKWLSVHY